MNGEQWVRSDNSLTQRLLLEEKEAGVNQLEVLGKVVELVQVLAWSTKVCRRSPRRDIRSTE